MRVELPVYQKCCFCLPLRYGLITWGYIRMMFSILLFIGLVLFFIALLYPLNITIFVYICISLLFMVFMLTDIALNIVFIIGGYKKSLKLLRTYYIYSIIFWVLTTLIAIAAIIYIIIMTKSGDIVDKLRIILIYVAILVAQLLIQAYVLLLVRSEIIKLRSNCQFRFVNTTESERMRCGEEIASGEDGHEDIHGRTYVPKDVYQFIGNTRRNDDSY